MHLAAVKLAMSMDCSAIISAVMAALLILLIAEFQAGVRSNIHVKRTLDEEYADPIKESVLAAYNSTPLSQPDQDRLQKELEKYQSLRRTLLRNVRWQYLFIAAGLVLSIALAMVLFWAARAKPADEAKIPEDAGIAWTALLVTLGRCTG